MDLLKRRYGKKTAIQRTLVNELLNARPVYSDRDTARLRSFYDLVETKYRALQALEVEEGVYSAIGTLSTDDGDGNGDVGTERKDWGENAVVVRILNIKHLPNLQR